MSNDAQLADVEGRTRPELLTRAAYLAGVAAERERCARIVEQTEDEGDWIGGGLTDDGDVEGSWWESDAAETMRSAAARIRDAATEVKE